MGIVDGGDSQGSQNCGEIDHSGQDLLTHSKSGPIVETPQQSVQRMEIDEGYKTGNTPHPVSKQDTSGDVTTDGLAIPGANPGNTLINPGPSRNTQMNSPTLIMWQRARTSADSNLCAGHMEVGRNTLHSTQDSGGSMQEIQLGNSQDVNFQFVTKDRTFAGCRLQPLHGMQVGSRDRTGSSIQGPDGSQQEVFLSSIDQQDLIRDDSDSVGRARVLTGRSTVAGGSLYVVPNRELEVSVIRDFQGDEPLQPLAANHGSVGDSVGQYTQDGRSGLRAVLIGDKNQVDKSRGLVFNRNTEQAELVQEVPTTRSRQGKPLQWITVNRNELSDSTLLNHTDQHQMDTGVIRIDQHPRRDGARTDDINRFTQENNHISVNQTSTSTPLWRIVSREETPRTMIRDGVYQGHTNQDSMIDRMTQGHDYQLMNDNNTCRQMQTAQTYQTQPFRSTIISTPVNNNAHTPMFTHNTTDQRVRNDLGLMTSQEADHYRNSTPVQYGKMENYITHSQDIGRGYHAMTDYGRTRLNGNQPMTNVERMGLNGDNSHFGSNMKPNFDDSYDRRGRTNQPMFSNRSKKITSYDGSTNWNDYLVQFEMISRLNGWDDYTKAMELGTSLKGPALAVMVDLDPGLRNNYSALVDALDIRFQSANSAEVCRVQLKTRTKKRSESLTELAQDIKRLTRQAFPLYTSTMREPLALDCFVDAIPDPDMKWTIYQSKPKNLDEALKLAIEYEGFRMAIDKRHQNKTTYNKPTQENYVFAMNRSYDNTEEHQGSKVKKCMNCGGKGHVRSECPSPCVCFGCGEEGHYRKDCKKSKKNTNNRKQSKSPVTQSEEEN